MAAMSAAIPQVLVQVERSFVNPGLRSLAVTRCPTVSSQVSNAFSIFEPPEVVSDVTSAGASGAAESGLPTYSEAAAQAAVGTNMLSGGIYGFCSHLLRPGIERAAANSGQYHQLVSQGLDMSVLGLAYAAAKGCQKTALRLGGPLSRIPLFGGTSAVARLAVFGAAALVGGKIGEIVMGSKKDESKKDESTETFFLSNQCIMCSSPFECGSDQSVAAFSCGHMCLCNKDECLGAYMANRNDCPLCRRMPIAVHHEVRI